MAHQQRYPRIDAPPAFVPFHLRPAMRTPAPVRRMRDFVVDLDRYVTERPMYWIREPDGTARPASLMEWAQTYDGGTEETRELQRRVKLAEGHSAKYGDYRVSTVFLGLDHGFSLDPETPPVLWETMIFTDNPLANGWQERARSEEEALVHFAEALDAVLNGTLELAPPKMPQGRMIE